MVAYGNEVKARKMTKTWEKLKLWRHGRTGRTSGSVGMRISLLLSLLLLLPPLPVRGQEVPLRPLSPMAELPASLATDPGADSFLVRENKLDSILFAHNSEEVYSSTLVLHLTTAVLAVEQLPPDSRITISQTAYELHEDQTLLRAGQRYPLAYLLRALLLEGEPTAMYALAEQLALTRERFLELLLARARLLNMAATTFYLESELPAAPVSEAPGTMLRARTSISDLSRLINAVMDNTRLSDLLRLRDETWFDSSGVSRYFRNQLSFVWNFIDGVDGGIIARSGTRRELVVLMTSRVKNFSYIIYLRRDLPPTPAVAETANERSLVSSLRRINQAVEATYELSTLARRGETYRENVPYIGEPVNLHFLNTVSYVHPLEDAAILESRLVLPEQTPRLPIYSSDSIGEVRFTLSDGSVLAVAVGTDRDIHARNNQIDSLLSVIDNNRDLVRLIVFLTAVMAVLILERLIRFLIRLVYRLRLKRVDSVRERMVEEPVRDVLASVQTEGRRRVLVPERLPRQARRRLEHYRRRAAEAAAREASAEQPDLAEKLDERLQSTIQKQIVDDKPRQQSRNSDPAPGKPGPAPGEDQQRIDQTHETGRSI